MIRDGIMREVTSAGGVVWRLGSDGVVEIVVCSLREPLSWRLPKGTPDSGESVEQTALREVREETGLQVRSHGYIDSVDYEFNGYEDGVRYHKVVHFYLMTAVGGDVSLHDNEFDFVEWVASDEAARTLTFDTEAYIVQKAVSMVVREACAD